MSPVSLFRVSENDRRIGGNVGRTSFLSSAFNCKLVDTRFSFCATGQRFVYIRIYTCIFDCVAMATLVRLVRDNLDLNRRSSRASLHYLIESSLINASRLFNFVRAL